MSRTDELAAQLSSFPLQSVETPLGRISYRTSGPNAGPNAGPTAGPTANGTTDARQATPLVLLHGIGSGAASWLRQLQHFGATRLVLAWNAPGYGNSSALPVPAPTAADYAARMWAWLDTLGIDRITLAGHSLGALMAGAAVRSAPTRVERLILLAPAGGYGKAEAEKRETMLRERLVNLANLGPAGMAEKRGAAMLSATASAQEIAFVKSVMAQIDPAGYTQACRMLAGGDLAGDLAALLQGSGPSGNLSACPPLTVASGSADVITPPTACARVAEAAGVPLQDLGPVGHLCAFEAATAVNRLIAGAAT